MITIDDGIAWVVMADGSARTATPGECAERIAELEAVLREIEADGCSSGTDWCGCKPVAAQALKNHIARKALNQ